MNIVIDKLNPLYKDEFKSFIVDYSLETASILYLSDIGSFWYGSCQSDDDIRFGFIAITDKRIYRVWYFPETHIGINRVPKNREYFYINRRGDSVISDWIFVCGPISTSLSPKEIESKVVRVQDNRLLLSIQRTDYFAVPDKKQKEKTWISELDLTYYAIGNIAFSVYSREDGRGLFEILKEIKDKNKFGF